MRSDGKHWRGQPTNQPRQHKQVKTKPAARLHTTTANMYGVHNCVNNITATHQIRVTVRRINSTGTPIRMLSTNAVIVAALSVTMTIPTHSQSAAHAWLASSRLRCRLSASGKSVYATPAAKWSKFASGS